MGKKGPSRHLKRELTPTSWPIHRKEDVWAVKTSPGPHGFKVSMPLLVVVRDVMGYAETSKEAVKIISEGKVLVDGVVRRDARFPVGLMDVVEFPDARKIYRILPEHGGRYRFHSLGREEAGFKLCRVIGKSTLNGGVTQLNLHDGRNLIPQEGAGSYSVNDVVKLGLSNKEILDHIEFNPGVRAIITGGRSQGQYGILIDLGEEPGDKRTATIRTSDNEDVRTLASYVFAVGTEKPLITLAGEL